MGSKAIGLTSSPQAHVYLLPRGSSRCPRSVAKLSQCRSHQPQQQKTQQQTTPAAEAAAATPTTTPAAEAAAATTATTTATTTTVVGSR